MSEIEHELRMYCDDECHDITTEELDRIFAELNTPPEPYPDLEPLPPLDNELPF